MPLFCMTGLDSGSATTVYKLAVDITSCYINGEATSLAASMHRGVPGGLPSTAKDLSQCMFSMRKCANKFLSSFVQEQRMCSNAYKIDSRLKKYQVLTGYIKWEHDVMMRRHQLRVKNMKPAIDNRCPDRGPFFTLNTKKMRLQADRINKIERKNRVIVRRLRAINEVTLPDFCHRKRRFRIRGDAYKPKPPSGRKDFRYDWEALRGSMQRRSLRRQETILRRLITSKNVTAEEAEKMKKYLPKVQEVPVDYLDYHKHDQKTEEGVPASESVRYVEDDEAQCILTKLAAIRLHMHYGDYIPGADSPYLDFHTKHKKLL